MVKLSFCLRRLPHLSREAFQKYWFETHAPLVRKQAAALRIQRYVQTHTLLGDAADALRATRGGPPGYDGVAELWWKSEEDIAAALGTPAGVEAGRILLEDERKFIDLANSPLFWAREREIIAGK
ncbi:MAG TPA: EthD domain-containing protein [Myxococcota bacterium]|nr:EthD domain-containing protein [Myxococcota bacterium]